jgi:tartrate-resistant acid phosphatase type 5
MVRLFLASSSMALAARINEVKVTGTSGMEDIVDYLLANAQSQEDAERVAEIVHKHWPLDAVPRGDRNMKASHVLATEARLASLDSRKNSSMLEEESCAKLSTLACAGDVRWAHRDGKRQAWAGEAYYDLPKYTGRSLDDAKLEDFHKLFYCSAALPNRCDAPPCTGCSEPPCDLCADLAALKEPIEQCHMHTYCVGMEGACCPQPDGTDHACCSYKPEIVYKDYAASKYTYRQSVPGAEVQKALHEGAFLGPLKATSCAAPSLKAMSAALSECADACTDNEECFAFSWDNDKCALFPRKCNPAYKAGSSMVFVKNRQRMTPHWLPTMDVSKRATGNHFLVIGDWGAESVGPNRESMHYVFKVANTTEKWKTDHHAQHNVAKVMEDVGQRVKPFMVVNAGDNFYWGGVLHEELGGRDIHDDVSFEHTFEAIYKDRSLMVPWLTVMGNHDYGGDGCMANVQAQFDYTIKDMLKNNRWKMPSPYYNHRVNFAEGYSAEFFMIDTNIEDAFVGRHGGICKQTICWETRGSDIVPYDECKAWFVKLWDEQTSWLKGVMPLSTADWKILVMHHKPHGAVANKLHPLVAEHNVQLMIGSHTHEMAFMDRWGSARKPLLVVGAGGGAQANPGCGNGIYCSRPHEYGMADVDIQEKQMVVTIYLHDGEEVFQRNICRDGSVRKDSC